MNPICDYHIHTPLCKHASGMPIEYIKRAHEVGLQIIGFSDHCPAPEGFDPECRMEICQIDEYLRIVNEVKSNPFNIKVITGMEIDYVPERMNEVKSFLSKYDFDYLIGSVHYVYDYPCDHPDYLKNWDRADLIDMTWTRYAILLEEMINSANIDIIGHIDLPKKFNRYPSDMNIFLERARPALKSAAEKGILVEINTSGKRKPVGEFYPCFDILKLIKKLGGRVTFGSDSHTPADVGYDFETARELAISAGFDEYTVIKESGEKESIKL